MTTEAHGRDLLVVLLLVVLLALTVMLYLPALGGPLLLDDSEVITPLLRAAELGHDWRLFLFSDSGPLGRPLAMASFIANAVASTDLRYWKATNLALHLVNGVLVHALAGRLARCTGVSADAARGVALGAAALWLLHPLNVSTVMYLCQRMTELATLFGVTAMWLYSVGRERIAAGRGGALPIALALLVCTPLAALGKEIGLLTPFYLLALEVCVFDPRRWPRPSWLRTALALSTVVPLALAATYFATHWYGTFTAPYSLRDFSPLERVLTEARVLLVYLGWIVAPRRAALGFHHDDVDIAHWPPHITTVLAVVALGALLVTAWKWRRRMPLAAFGVLLFFVGHALESSVFALELVFEHRNYLPAIGICLALAALAAQWLTARRATLLLATLALLYALVTASMTPTWGNAGALYASFFEAHPRSLRARANLVEWLLTRGDTAAAARVLGDASDAGARLHRLRIACLATHETAGQDAAFKAAAELARPDAMTVEILLWLTAQVLDGACALDSTALAATLDALRDRPLSHNTRYLMYVSSAQLRHARGEHALATAAAAYAARLAPADPYPVYLGVEIALDADDRAAARALIDEARARARRQHADFSRMDAGLDAELQGR